MVMSAFSDLRPCSQDSLMLTVTDVLRASWLRKEEDRGQRKGHGKEMGFLRGYYSDLKGVWERGTSGTLVMLIL